MKQPLARIALLCILILGWSLSTEAQGQTPTAQTPAPKDAGLIEMTVTVSDLQGRCLTGLNKENFLVQVDKSPQPIVHFSARQEPASIVFLIDLSGSMRTGNSKASLHGFAARSIQQILETYDRPDEFSVIVFSREPELTLGWTQERTKVIKSLGDVADLKPKGQTAFRNAVSFGLEQFKNATNQRRIVIIFSDADDNSANLNIKSIPYNKLVQMLRPTGAVVYAVNLGVMGTNMHTLYDFTATSILNNLAKVSGGKAFHPAEVVGLFLATKQILMETLCQYSIEFKPNHPSSASDKLHKVKVELAPQFLAESNLRGLKVYHRDGYYWSSPNSKPIR